jgi:hypothetical protein
VTTTPTREVDEGGGTAAEGSPAAPDRRSRPWWRTWRMGLAVLIIVPAFIGQIAGTDDAWPFAPFRMFASPTRRTTNIVHPEFYGVFEGDKRVAMFSTDFHIRPAEVESELNKQHRMPPSMFADIATTYNGLHPRHPLHELDLRMVGQAIVNGRPGVKVNHVVQRWVTS